MLLPFFLLPDSIAQNRGATSQVHRAGNGELPGHIEKTIFRQPQFLSQYYFFFP
jgi:hypothetical protein